MRDEKEVHRQLQHLADGMPMRNRILHTSLVIEHATADMICKLLKIDRNTSKTFGHSSGSLSFNQKIRFLIEMGALSSEDYKLFQVFMEVRNVIAHVLETNTLEKVFELLDEKVDYVLRLSAYEYDGVLPNMKQKDPRNPALSREKQLGMGVDALAALVAARTMSITQVIVDRSRQEIETTVYKRAVEVFDEQRHVLFESINERFETSFPDEGVVNKDRARGFMMWHHVEMRNSLIQAVNQGYKEQFGLDTPFQIPLQDLPPSSGVE